MKNRTISVRVGKPTTIIGVYLELSAANMNREPKKDKKDVKTRLKYSIGGVSCS